MDAGSKVMVTPTHVYITNTGGIRKDKAENSESIYAGGANSAIYIMVGGKWTRTRLTAGDMLKQQEENHRTAPSNCRYLREATTWISKNKGLPLRAEVDLDVGGALGKSHMSMRFDYSNVHPPAGVQ